MLQYSQKISLISKAGLFPCKLRAKGGGKACCLENEKQSSRLDRA